ncbi:hypothetical protein HanIR_Chr15g0742121 [Helianthus annuus]|nr:hypothetical protein HanIR_Chr15g0742121 [Helianthus annuus]
MRKTGEWRTWAGRGRGNHQLIKPPQETAMNCHYSSYFCEFKWLRFNLSQIQW